ncbi:MAG: hypothetical protein LT071_10145 [Nocardioides sp.]|nr:hypothetical protein [Nocardioides sp.]
MTRRGFSVLALLVVLGAIGGYAASALAGEQPTASGAPVPAHASAPDYPADPPPVLVPDTDYPVLQPGIAMARGSVGSDAFALVFPVPKGWDMTRSSSAETKWYPPDNPGYTYGLRVEQTDALRASIAATLADRVNDLTEAEDHLEVVSRTADSLHFTYVTDDRLRHGLLRWMDLTGSGIAEVEISVNGREADLPGMEALIDAVARGMRRR